MLHGRSAHLQVRAAEEVAAKKESKMNQRIDALASSELRLKGARVIDCGVSLFCGALMAGGCVFRRTDIGWGRCSFS